MKYDRFWILTLFNAFSLSPPTWTRQLQVIVNKESDKDTDDCVDDYHDDYDHDDYDDDDDDYDQA